MGTACVSERVFKTLAFQGYLSALLSSGTCKRVRQKGVSPILLTCSENSSLNMTGRPGYWTMEMNGGSSAPYLACTPCVPLFVHCFNKGGSRGAFRLPGASGGSFPLYGGTFARSYSVSTYQSSSKSGYYMQTFFVLNELIS